MLDVISFDDHERSVYQLCKDFLDALASLAVKLSVSESYFFRCSVISVHTVNTVHTANTVHTVNTVCTVGIVNIANTVNSVNSV